MTRFGSDRLLYAILGSQIAIAVWPSREVSCLADLLKVKVSTDGRADTSYASPVMSLNLR